MSEIGSFTLLAILVQALGYAGGLLAVGSGLFLLAYARRSFPASHPTAARRLVARTARLGGLGIAAAGLMTLADLGVRAGRLSGMGLSGMTDPMMLAIVWEGPVGAAVLVRLTALAVLAAGLFAFRHTAGRVLIGIGALGYAFSYTFVGHATQEPQWLLTAVLTLHLLAVSFWFGALAPLTVVARRLAVSDAARLLTAFGHAAVWVVGALVAAGATFAAFLIQTPTGLLGSGYGQILLFKLAIVILLLSLAALNKLRLVPALEAGYDNARGRLVRSIRLEALAFVTILLTTAVLTSIASPPEAIKVVPLLRTVWRLGYA